MNRPRVLHLIVLVPLLGLAQACGTSIKVFDERDIDTERLVTAHAAVQNGKWYEASIEWRSITEDFPYYGQGWHMLGLCYDQLNELDRAIDCYTQADRYLPQHTPTKHNLAVDLIARNEIDRGIVLLEQVIAQDRYYSKGYYNLAVALLYQNRHDRALTAIDQCILLIEDGDPTDTEGLQNIYETKTYILLEMKRPGEARKVYDRLLSLGYTPNLDLKQRMEFGDGAIKEAAANEPVKQDPAPPPVSETPAETPKEVITPPPSSSGPGRSDERPAEEEAEEEPEEEPAKPDESGEYGPGSE